MAKGDDPHWIEHDIGVGDTGVACPDRVGEPGERAPETLHAAVTLAGGRPARVAPVTRFIVLSVEGALGIHLTVRRRV